MQTQPAVLPPIPSMPSFPAMMQIPGAMPAPNPPQQYSWLSQPADTAPAPAATAPTSFMAQMAGAPFQTFGQPPPQAPQQRYSWLQ